MIKKQSYPTRCPMCGSRDAEEDYDHDETELVETCTCCDCTYQWVRVYEFVEWHEA